MIVPIYTYGDEILTKKSEEVDFDDTTLPELIQNLYDTMRNSTLAIGLCAPQIGVSKRLFIIEGDSYGLDNFHGVFINPRIVSNSGYLHEYSEPCLSFPGDLTLDIKRPTIIELEWYDEKKEQFRDFFVDMQAKIIQHEVDHLDGVLITDRTTTEELTKNASILEKIKNKKMKSEYPIFKPNNDGSVRSKGEN